MNGPLLIRTVRELALDLETGEAQWLSDRQAREAFLTACGADRAVVAAMLVALEQTGEPQVLLAHLARWLEQSQRLRGRVARTVNYLTMLLTGAAFLATLVAGWLMPNMLDRLVRSGPDMAGLAGAAGVVRGAGWIWVALALGLAALVRLLLGKGQFLSSGPLQRLMPELARVAGQSEQATWALAVAGQLRAGACLPDALETAAVAVTNPQIRERARLAAEACRSGSSAEQALQAQSFDPLLVWAVAWGTSEDRMVQLLEETVAVMEHEVVERSEVQLAWLEPLAVLLAALLVLATLMTFWLPYRWMVEQLMV